MNTKRLDSVKVILPMLCIMLCIMGGPTLLLVWLGFPFKDAFYCIAGIALTVIGMACLAVVTEDS